jgi:ribosomal-protein-alanine N-acetyltransferase
MSAILKELSLDFRPMQVEDLQQVIDVESQSYPHPWTEVIFSDCLHAGYSCWVCGRYGMVEAYGIISTGAGESHLLNICVHPESRKQGIGKKMLRHLIAVAQRHNADVVFLEVRPSNVAARTLYENEGFNELGTRRDYYPAPEGREDALILARTL